MKRIVLIVLGFLPILVSAQWQYIPADHPAIEYTGRFDFSNPKAVRFDWPGTNIRFRFTGSNLQVLLEGGDRNYFNVFIDGKLFEVIHASKDTTYTVAGLTGKEPHTFRLQKRTEGEMGTAVFKGVNIGLKDKLDKWPFPSERKIEFIGNSITCGYGTEGTSRKEDFLPQTENVDKSYAFITARAFNAECVVTAHSGLGVVRNYGNKEWTTLIDRYFQTLDEDPTSNWDFARWQPDALVINLGTNDYWAEPYPNKIVFQRRYEQFIRQLREVYGDIPVFCICGPMRNEPTYSVVKEMVEQSRTIYNDTNIYFIGIPAWLLNKESDLGSDWHPSYRGQRKMAAHIIPAIANVLHWAYVDEELRFTNGF